MHVERRIHAHQSAHFGALCQTFMHSNSPVHSNSVDTDTSDSWVRNLTAFPARPLSINMKPYDPQSQHKHRETIHNTSTP